MMVLRDDMATTQIKKTDVWAILSLARDIKRKIKIEQDIAETEDAITDLSKEEIESLKTYIYNYYK